MVEAQQRLMEMEQRELEAIVNRRCVKELHLWRKVLKFQILSILCGHKQNKTMTNI